MRNSNVRTMGVVGFIIVAILSAAGCAASNSSVVRAPLGPIPAKPIAGVRESVRGMRSESPFPDRAVDVVAARCMKDLQLPFEPLPNKGYIPSPIPHPYSADTAKVARVGFWDPAPAQRGLTDEEVAQRSAPAATQKQIARALFGPDGGPTITVPDILVGGTISFPTTGCLAEGRKAVYGDLHEWATHDNFASNFVPTVMNTAMDSPEMGALNSAWATCMQDAGYSGLASPEAARERAAHSLPEHPSRSDYRTTITLAIADSRCETAGGYERQRERVEERYLSAGFSHYQAQIAGAREMYARGAAHARIAVLGS